MTDRKLNVNGQLDDFTNKSSGIMRTAIDGVQIMAGNKNRVALSPDRAAGMTGGVGQKAMTDSNPKPLPRGFANYNERTGR